jgi:primosomal protein N' (replication factor Y)
MTQYIEIAVNVPRVSGVFHYHLPLELEGKLQPGHLVLVSFGEQLVQGVVLGEVAEPQVPETKPVEALLDPEPVLSPLQLELAQHIAESTLAPLAAAVNLMLPPGIGEQADMEYALTGEEPSGKLSGPQQSLLAILRERGPLRGRQLDRAVPRRNWRASMVKLRELGQVESTPVLPKPSARPKTVRTAELIITPERATDLYAELGGTEATRSRRAAMLAALAREGGPVDASWLYAESDGNLRDLYLLEEQDLLRLSERESYRDPLAEIAYDPSLPLKLTADQQRVWDDVHKALARAHSGEVVKPILLHGVTGSGKTEIYLQAVGNTLSQGKRAIVLVPEIALTPQTVRRFQARFPGRVGLLHSELSDGERYDTWRRARAAQLDVIVGPRSALFAPVENLGLIVVDESHDDSYYEAGSTPHYHARRVAVAYARLAGAVCLMGSATPEITSYYQAQRGQWQLLELPARILAHRATAAAHLAKFGNQAHYQDLGGEVEALELPPVDTVDMRHELRAGNRSIFSRALQAGLQQVLDQGQQAILFLNRRGSATYIFCRDCGEGLHCPNCETPLTLHVAKRAAVRPNRGASGALICHHCGYTRDVPKTCPNCGSANIKHYGTGTERVEAELKKMFPEVRTLRWDRESTRQKGGHDRILRAFGAQEANVLVGTQMLAKGLDLPLVTLVGVVLADVGLHLPDFRAAERVFQVLTQVAGRAGRSPLGGQVVLQTFHPEHYAIQAAAQHDYAGFYAAESGHRRRLRYPPFAQLLRLEYRHLDPRKAEQDARSMAATLAELLEKQERRATDLIGPVPCFYARLNREYRWQILLRGPDPAAVVKGLKLVGWRVELNPPALL